MSIIRNIVKKVRKLSNMDVRNYITWMVEKVEKTVIDQD